jgi:hypothetical protein
MATIITNFNGYPIVSQNPEIPTPDVKAYAESHYLPELVRAWKAIEQGTGYRWKSTSYWRRSPTHVHGEALDLAPDIAPSAAKYYAVTHLSDPVLYKRLTLLKKLINVAHNFRPGPYTIGVFIEPDHLHVQVLKKEVFHPGMRIVRWKQEKPVYSDTSSRIKLPLITDSVAKRLTKRFR